MKDAEVLLFIALAAKHRLNLFKSDTKQAFLNGDMGEEKILISPPAWWSVKVPQGYALQLIKCMYGTQQAVRQCHVRISTWMEEHGYLAVNREKTIFMRREGEEWKMHGLFVDDMIHAATNDELHD